MCIKRSRGNSTVYVFIKQIISWENAYKTFSLGQHGMLLSNKYYHEKTYKTFSLGQQARRCRCLVCPLRLHSVKENAERFVYNPEEALVHLLHWRVPQPRKKLVPHCAVEWHNPGRSLYDTSPLCANATSPEEAAISLLSSATTLEEADTCLLSSATTLEEADTCLLSSATTLEEAVPHCCPVPQPRKKPLLVCCPVPQP